jgi:hypothetical protein
VASTCSCCRRRTYDTGRSRRSCTATYNGQAIADLSSDPLGKGWDLFGAAGSTINYGVVGATTIWYVQVGVLVAGHVCGLVLAHDRALALYGKARAATTSQYWMLAVMVAFTTFGQLHPGEAEQADSRGCESEAEIPGGESPSRESSESRRGGWLVGTLPAGSPVARRSSDQPACFVYAAASSASVPVESRSFLLLPKRR